jgi:hypothetical protein
MIRILPIVMLLAACQPSVEPENPPLVGGDRDEHGCIGSAGYVWDEARQDCVRPWEVG